MRGAWDLHSISGRLLLAGAQFGSRGSTRRMCCILSVRHPNLFFCSARLFIHF